jgi:4-hydroxyproline epimerase
MADQCAVLARDFDDWRAATLLEPRGSDVIVGALLREPVDPANTAGVIFFNNVGYLGMCGHGTIGLIASLAHLGRIKPGVHRIETTVGVVTAKLHEDGSVSVQNVPSYRYLHRVRVSVPGHGVIHGDVAWGGNWFFLVADHGQRVNSDNLNALTTYSCSVRDALAAQGVTGSDGQPIDHIELFASDSTGADSRNFVLCPGSAYDRSPCGTGTSAKIACLAADGKLAPGEDWTQASIIGSRFVASYTPHGDSVVPTIRGRAHLSAESTLLIEGDDPFAWGIRL